MSFGSKKIQVIKEVRAITGGGLKETKELVESAPCEIIGGLAGDVALAHAQRLLDVGARVSIEAE
ncbi:MAG: ribosomal protein L7/L12 [Myxococcales bacterium]|nr:ribosomal protein L7/L12 [Myxococcales bacterium]